MKGLIIIAVCLAVANASLFNPKIIGGEVSSQGKWPWQLSLQVWSDDTEAWSHWCGAVLINANWALTSAQCVYDLLGPEPDYYSIWAGAFNQSNDDAVQKIVVDQIIIHPEFDVTDIIGEGYDVALLRLSESADVDNENIGAVALPAADDDFEGNQDAWITGWGAIVPPTGDDQPESTNVLRELNIPVWNNLDCEIEYLPMPIYEDHICVGTDAGNSGSCAYDYGGPLSAMQDGQYVLAGLSSRGPADCSGSPAVFMRISYYVDWIRNTTATRH